MIILKSDTLSAKKEDNHRKKKKGDPTEGN